MVKAKKLPNGQKIKLFVQRLSYLLIHIPEIGACQIIPPNGSMEAFIWLGVVVPGNTLCNDIIKEVGY